VIPVLVSCVIRMKDIVILISFAESMTSIPVEKFGPLRIKMDAPIILITPFKKSLE